MKREFNHAADYLTSKSLVQGESWTVQDDLERRHLEVVSKIREHRKAVALEFTVETPCETLVKKKAIQEQDMVLALSVHLYLLPPESWRYSRDGGEVPLVGPLEFQAERWRRIKVHREGDEYLAELRAFLNGDLDRFSPTRLQKISKVADLFVLDDRGILYRLLHSVRGRPRDAVDNLRLVVPNSLREDMLHHAHEDFQGEHQGITRTHEKLRAEFYWTGMNADVQHFVKECVDCASGPPNAGPSPGNIEPRCPFEAVSMEFVTHLPESARGNTSLLLLQGRFSGYVRCKPMSSTTAQDVSEAYEEQMFQGFGASSMIRDDQDPRFMTKVADNVLHPDTARKRMDSRGDLYKPSFGVFEHTSPRWICPTGMITLSD
ncbi:reverse transcriptase [Phytophthora megakarya]|uniref:Reverse transcriptase n=1 Tax=Phytophthora megakarya TaxID=4795 RepID=A0A225VTX3_9STRA|nr:reverse transcriptase [Phytophthora megakarya]